MRVIKSYFAILTSHRIFIAFDFWKIKTQKWPTFVSWRSPLSQAFFIARQHNRAMQSATKLRASFCSSYAYIVLGLKRLNWTDRHHITWRRRTQASVSGLCSLYPRNKGVFLFPILSTEYFWVVKISQHGQKSLVSAMHGNWIFDLLSDF